MHQWTVSYLFNKLQQGNSFHMFRDKLWTRVLPWPKRMTWWAYASMHTPVFGRKVSSTLCYKLPVALSWTKQSCSFLCLFAPSWLLCFLFWSVAGFCGLCSEFSCYLSETKRVSVLAYAQTCAWIEPWKRWRALLCLNSELMWLVGFLLYFLKQTVF